MMDWLVVVLTLCAVAAVGAALTATSYLRARQQSEGGLVTEQGNTGFLQCVCVLCSHGNGRGVFPRTFTAALFFGSCGGAATFLWGYFGGEKYSKTISQDMDLSSYTSLLVGLLLVFRTTNSYGRYDAGVAAAGSLRTTTRQLVSQAVAHAPVPKNGGLALGANDDGVTFILVIHRLTMLYSLMFKRRMHEQDDKPLEKLLQRQLLLHEELAPLSTAAPASRAILTTQWLRNTIGDAMQAGLLKDAAAQMMDESCNELLANYQRASKVAFVGTPFPWRQVVKVVITLYCLLSPFAYVSITKWGTPGASFVFSWLIFSIEEVAVEIEDPFGKKSNTSKHSDIDHQPQQTDAVPHYVSIATVIKELDTEIALLLATRLDPTIERRLLLPQGYHRHNQLTATKHDPNTRDGGGEDAGGTAGSGAREQDPLLVQRTVGVRMAGGMQQPS